jgi:hypothetical protein
MRDNGIYGSSCYRSSFINNYCEDSSGTGIKTRGDDNSIIGNTSLRCVVGFLASGLYAPLGNDGSNGHSATMSGNTARSCEVGVWADDIDINDGVPSIDQRCLSDVIVTENQIYGCTSATASPIILNVRRGLVCKDNIIDDFLSTVGGMYIAKHKVATGGNTEWLEGVDIGGNIIRNGPKAFEFVGLSGGSVYGGRIENMTTASVIKANLFDCQDLVIENIATSDPTYRLSTTTSTGKLKIFNTGFSLQSSLDAHWTQGNAVDRNLNIGTAIPAYNKQVTFNGTNLYMSVGTVAVGDWKQIS